VADDEPTIVIGELQLPSGAVVVLRDPEELTGADHRQIMSSLRGNPENEDLLVSLAMDLLYMGTCLLIESWTVPYLPGLLPPSKEPSHLGKLRLRDYNTVIEAAGPSIELLFPKDSGIDDAGVPGSPTGPASA